MKTKVLFVFYKLIVMHLPNNNYPFLGKYFRSLRYTVCKQLFKHCGKNVNIERGARFGYGNLIEIGDSSGLGRNCRIPHNTKIGNYVMMAPNVQIFASNHQYERTDIPMCQQGHTQILQTLIEDDVWIGSNVIMTPGRTIKKGSIIAAGCVLTKDFPEYSIVGGNPGKFIRSRLT